MNLVEPANTDTVATPPTGYIKVSIANFTRHLPQNIELAFIQDDPYTGSIDTAAIFSNPGKSFSDYKLVKMFPLPGGFNNLYRITLMDAATKTELALITDPVTGEPIDWSWFINLEANTQTSIYTVYLYSFAEDPSAPTHYSTFINNF